MANTMHRYRYESGSLKCDATFIWKMCNLTHFVRNAKWQWQQTATNGRKHFSLFTGDVCAHALAKLMIAKHGRSHIDALTHALSLVTFSGRKRTRCTFLCNLCLNRTHRARFIQWHLLLWQWVLLQLHSCKAHTFCIFKQTNHEKTKSTDDYTWCHQKGSIPTRGKKRGFCTKFLWCTCDSRLPKINIVNHFKLRLDYRLKRSNPRNHKPLSLLLSLLFAFVQMRKIIFEWGRGERSKVACVWCTWTRSL